jgi:hypothetical protein
LEETFKNNSAVILENEQLRDSLQKVFNCYYEISEILIKTSRNTGDFENITWEEGSLLRANNIKDITTKLNYTLGCENPVKEINDSMIKIDASGENGDGTSGPKSPYEVEDKYIQYYKNNNIDEKYWESNAKEKPLSNISEYDKFNNVEIFVNGVVLEENEDLFRNFKYLQMIQLDSGKKISKKTRPILFGGGKPNQYDGGKVGAVKCSKPQNR